MTLTDFIQAVMLVVGVGFVLYILIADPRDDD
jgi:hypothetical protein